MLVSAPVVLFYKDSQLNPKSAVKLFATAPVSLWLCQSGGGCVIPATVTASGLLIAKFLVILQKHL